MLLESFVAEGRTPLPDGAYLLRGGTNTSYMTVPTGAEVRDLFQDAQSYQKFLVSMALRGWATGAVESCTTDLMTAVSKSGRVATLDKKEGTALLTMRPILPRDRLGLGAHCFPGCALACSCRRSSPGCGRGGEPVQQRSGEALRAKTSVHSSKGRLVVTIVDPRS